MTKIRSRHRTLLRWRIKESDRSFPWISCNCPFTTRTPRLIEMLILDPKCLHGVSSVQPADEERRDDVRCYAPAVPYVALCVQWTEAGSDSSTVCPRDQSIMSQYSNPHSRLGFWGNNVNIIFHCPWTEHTSWTYVGDLPIPSRNPWTDERALSCTTLVLRLRLNSTHKDKLRWVLTWSQSK